MSLINEYRNTEETIKELQARLQSLSQDKNLQTELEFEAKLRDLMGEYQKSLRDITALLDPEARNSKPGRVAPVKTTGTKRARKVKQYKNPHNGEIVETKGGNHKTLKEWKAKWGGDEVESWATLLG
ncbi:MULTISPECIES: histone-like nucleoid-structuring protein MvaT [Pseudomonas]|uniref:DNA binding protein n=1 Tax=Pseudomonas quercus TaxID=2722792 RepID=A0ABX0YAG6_9PSED|nr:MULTISPECIES: histone-like nucleoid-structuring protein MvaT [Pseudomonas]MBF7141775.1 DNA binding protein [Pseudomonas sp. LY10J]NJP00314.1 DNA binding protein [Pseudomonas quercus]